jgi:hypothetical protein
MRSMMVGAAALFLAVFALSSPAVAAAPVAMIDLDGAITPVTARLLTAAIERAQAERAQALIVRLNTPGGLERSMRSMAQAIPERRDSRHRVRGSHRGSSRLRRSLHHHGRARGGHGTRHQYWRGSPGDHRGRGHGQGDGEENRE